MNKLITLLAAMFFSSFLLAQKPFMYTIEGTAKNYKNDYIFLTHKWDEVITTDSAKVVNGKFKFAGKSPESNMYWLTFDKASIQQPSIIFYIDAGKTTIDFDIDSLQNLNIKGGKSNEDYQDYRMMMLMFNMQQQEIIGAYNTARANNDMATMQAKQAEFEKLTISVKDGLKNFVKNHSKSPVSGFIIYSEYANPANFTMQEVEEVLSFLDPSIKKTKFGRLAQQRVDNVRGTTTGYPATNFSQETPDGKVIKLSDYKGKVVLVDFWASWCGPCRAENPNVVAAYQKFKDKGFTILGVSFDQNKDAWLKAIEKDQLTWDHVSDLKGWGNEVGRIYNISSIPQNILVGKDGKIIDKNLRGPALEEKLQEIFK